MWFFPSNPILLQTILSSFADSGRQTDCLSLRLSIATNRKTLQNVKNNFNKIEIRNAIFSIPVSIFECSGLVWFGLLGDWWMICGVQLCIFKLWMRRTGFSRAHIWKSNLNHHIEKLSSPEEHAVLHFIWITSHRGNKFSLGTLSPLPDMFYSVFRQRVSQLLRNFTVNALPPFKWLRGVAQGEMVARRLYLCWHRVNLVSFPLTMLFPAPIETAISTCVINNFGLSHFGQKGN